MNFKLTKQLDEDLVTKYFAFLGEKESTLFYQNPVFHQFLSKHLRADLYYFIWQNDDNILASFPFMVKHDEVIGGVLNSLPYYGSNGSLVFALTATREEKNEIRNDLKGRLNSFYRDHRIILSTLISNPLEQEEMVWLRENWKTDFKDHRIGQITELPRYSDTIEADLFDLYDNPRPRNIRRAIKADLKVSKRWGNESLDFLYKVHKDNIDSIGGLTKRKEFFMQIPNYFDESSYAVFVAEKGGEPIAALLVFYFNKTVEYFTPATIHEFRNDQPSALIIHEAMKAAAKDGYKYWNWGGTWESQEGVYDFKKRWGASDHRYEYFIQILDDKVKEIPIQDLKVAFPNFYLYPY
tara:strand:- start:75526 stop:76581 length:1056 start_codon:yes stop_codon:yes gene_type:complete